MQEREPFILFFTDIQTQAVRCEYEHLKDSMICDWVIIGIPSDKTRRRLMNLDNLNLEKVVLVYWPLL